MSELTANHLKLLEQVGLSGIEPERVRDGRDFGHLERLGLVVFWQIGRGRPDGIYGAGVAPGRWYLSHAGAEAIGLIGRPLRLS
ncbi:MAG TPA: hypothetical protein VLJ44_08615 [Gaiellaceae bacterium]|nr:hypothetical protein [Gaiellaceae bacterium]